MHRRGNISVSDGCGIENEGAIIEVPVPVHVT
jgi:hypothetical protein